MSTSFFTPYPKYLQVRAILLRRLQHEFAPGDRFPTELALSEEFGVSRETVREALLGLEEQGLITRVRGRGTTVQCRPRLSADLRLTGLVEDFTELKRDTWCRILAKEVSIVRPAITEKLGLAAKEPVYLIRRLRMLDGEPLAVHEAYLPVEFGVPLSRRDLTRTTVSHELRSRFAIEFREDYQEIDATTADPQFAQLLAVAVGAPLLQVRRRYLDPDDRPLVLFQTWFRSDRYYATVKFPRTARDDAGKESPRRRRRAGVAGERNRWAARPDGEAHRGA